MHATGKVVTLRLILSAGAAAFVTTALVQVIFGKTVLAMLWNAAEISVATFASTAVLAKAFLRSSLTRRRMSRRLLIATAGLLLVYPLFAVIHAPCTDRATTVFEERADAESVA